MHILIVLPAYNEEKIIVSSLAKLYAFMERNFFNDSWQIVVADNASTDLTAFLVQSFHKQHQKAQYYFSPEKGKGRAIREAWKYFPADVYCFMDADLSTDLVHVPTLVSLVKEGIDIVIGNRFMKGSRLRRSLVRRVISQMYNKLARSMIKTKVTDLSCGFKAVNKKIVEQLLDEVENNTWFFDAELVLRAESAGYTISQVPVSWSDAGDAKRKSRIQYFGRTGVVFEYIKMLVKLRKKIV